MVHETVRLSRSPLAPTFLAEVPWFHEGTEIAAGPAGMIEIAVPIADPLPRVLVYNARCAEALQPWFRLNMCVGHVGVHFANLWTVRRSINQLVRVAHYHVGVFTWVQLPSASLMVNYC